MLRKTLLITTIAIVLLSLSPSGVLADTGLQPPTPDAPLDCGVWAYNPVKSGSNVNGQAEVSCLTNHASLRVVAGIKDVTTGNYMPKTKTCYNAKSCSITATLPYVSGHYWQTDVSGYVADISWQAYYATNWVYIP